MMRTITSPCPKVPVVVVLVSVIALAGIPPIQAYAQSASSLSNLVGTSRPRASERAAALSAAAAALEAAVAVRTRSDPSRDELPAIARMRDSARALRVNAANAEREVAGNNPWLAGAQLGYKFAGNGDFSDNMFVAGTVRYDIDLDPEAANRWQLPVFSNLGSLAANASNAKTPKDSLTAAANALLSSAHGIVVRLAPFKVLRDTTNTRTTLFLTFGGKVNSLPARDTALDDQELLQGRVSAGFDFAFGKRKSRDDDRRPLTISLAGVASFFSASAYNRIFGERKSSIQSFEVTTIVPIDKGAGVLMEAVMAREYQPAIRLGLLVMKK